MALNVSLVDMSPENGSTEIWLGTSKIARYDDMREGVFGILQEKLDERRKVRPPVYPVIKRGSLILRDIRTWWVRSYLLGLCTGGADLVS